ncbi:MAG: 23S rRNA (uracil(1939)-C(5))-methyltransferase RlmD [Bacteroidales bacterium]|nr:23S rRNA (uracil(1939)-C(5))-methyltransferase RlmD [Bacteroidales bacterium]
MFRKTVSAEILFAELVALNHGAHGAVEHEDADSLSPADRCGLGFHVGKFFDKVLDLNCCYLQPEPSNSIRLFAKAYALGHGIPFYNIRENTGIFRSIFVRTTESGGTMVIACFACEFDGREAFLEALAAEFPQISSLYYIINAKVNDSISDQTPLLYRGEDAIYEEMEGLRFKIGPKSFFQTNTLQACSLYRVVREYAGLTGTETVYDLYTGTGTIAQFVSRNAAKVIGIEYVPEAIEDAKINASANGISNCEFYAGDMKDVLDAEFIDAHGQPDVIILDPPRAGIHPDVAKVILQARPGRIVYVSCNPASQARDLSLLCADYTIEAVQPVDMFPHTQHVENVCKLIRKD